MARNAGDGEPCLRGAVVERELARGTGGVECLWRRRIEREQEEGDGLGRGIFLGMERLVNNFVKDSNPGM